MGTETTNTGLGLAGLGDLLAATLSYCKWHSFWLAVGHFFLGWIYVFYHVFTYGLPIIRRY
jgi:hypothetical protein